MAQHELKPLITVSERPQVHEPQGETSSAQNFGFFDNRQKYLLFVTTCSEKAVIAKRVGLEFAHLHPKPPALRVFDAGMGDGTVLTSVIREMHRQFPARNSCTISSPSWPSIGRRDIVRRPAIRFTSDRWRSCSIATTIAFCSTTCCRVRDARGPISTWSWRHSPIARALRWRSSHPACSRHSSRPCVPATAQIDKLTTLLPLVTQFSFAPLRIVEWCGQIARQYPGMPIHVGIAGPTHPVALLKYAHRCGVSASRRALRHLGTSIARLVINTDPEQQVTSLAKYCEGKANCNVVGVHFFTFGGAVRTAAWLKALHQ